MLFGGSNQMLVPCNEAVSKSGAWLHFRRECGDGGNQDSRNRVWELILSRKHVNMAQRGAGESLCGGNFQQKAKATDNEGS